MTLTAHDEDIRTAIPCETCEGTGEINLSRAPWHDEMEACPDCQGWKIRCPHCGEYTEVNDGGCCWCGEPLKEE